MRKKLNSFVEIEDQAEKKYDSENRVDNAMRIRDGNGDD